MTLTAEQERRIYASIKSVLEPTAPLVSVCAWCPDAAQRTAALVRAGHEVSHGLCPTCAGALLPESSR
jgi:hypothetical protein